MSLLNELNKWVNPLRRKINMIVQRAIVDLVNDDGAMQVLQVTLNAETIQDEVERAQNYGFTSVPSKGDEVILVNQNGDRSLSVAIAVDSSASRPSGLQSGDVAVYNKKGSTILLKNDGDIEIYCDGKVDIKSGEINLGDGAAHKKLATEDFVNQVYKLHTHATAPTGPISVPTPIAMATELTSKTKAE